MIAAASDSRAVTVDGRIHAAEFVAGRVLRLAKTHGVKADNGPCFVVLPVNDRIILAFVPAIAELPAKLVDRLRDDLAGRKVVYTQNAGRCFLQVAYWPRSEKLDTSKLKPLPTFPGKQIILYGPTGSGKSSAIQHILGEREGTHIILDAHYKPGNWHPKSIVIGAGRKWDNISAAIDYLDCELDTRYTRRAQGGDDFEPLTVVIDELSQLMRAQPDAGRKLIGVAQEGRKVGIFVILTPHSTEVQQLGFEGAGDARENFIFIGLSAILPGEETKPRVASVVIGNPRRSHNEAIGKYLVPPPQVYQGTPRLATDLGAALGVSEAVSEAVSGHVADSGHAADMAKDPISAYDGKYARGTHAADDLAEYLVSHGYGVRKIGEVLPYRAADARKTAQEAIERLHGIGIKPDPESTAERAMVTELAQVWGMPAHRIARLLDGNDVSALNGRIAEWLNGG